MGGAQKRSEEKRIHRADCASFGERHQLACSDKLSPGVCTCSCGGKASYEEKRLASKPFRFGTFHRKFTTTDLQPMGTKAENLGVLNCQLLSNWVGCGFLLTRTRGSIPQTPSSNHQLEGSRDWKLRTDTQQRISRSRSPDLFRRNRRSSARRSGGGRPAFALLAQEVRGAGNAVVEKWQLLVIPRWWIPRLFHHENKNFEFPRPCQLLRGGLGSRRSFQLAKLPVTIRAA